MNNVQWLEMKCNYCRLISQFSFMSSTYGVSDRHVQLWPITVAGWSKAWIVFSRSNTGIVGSNRTWDMDVYVRLFCVCSALCAGSGLAASWSPVQEVLPTVQKIKKLKKIGQGATKGCRAVDRCPAVTCDILCGSLWYWASRQGGRENPESQ
jgi:hypothetical protein